MMRSLRFTLFLYLLITNPDMNGFNRCEVYLASKLDQREIPGN
ncbi:hypothetical protein AM1_3793 [Acaryochloris marina MBIC11017]|uniref:Uncharacterized protein n=1 Tax=Acaryochloris marina (strain MBIC 11017) TaxID=329726 RepID=B0C5R0_ACAM1|nr:hypothetical protein AM1_3793 [Acaryochloris marina MBIC11017]